MKTKRRGRILSAVVGATVLAISALGGGVAMAAVPGDGGTGTIIVHKFENPDTPTGLPADGSAIDPTELDGLKPLPGVGFTVVPITGIDLSTQEGWLALKNLSVSVNPTTGEPILSGTGVPPIALGTPMTEQYTGAAGDTTFNVSADKAYVVYESSPLPGTTTVAQPTILTVPYPGAKPGDAWNYNVNIYPKNVVVDVASKDATVVGNNIVWNVNYDVLSLGAGKTYTEFKIADTLGAGITYVSSRVYLTDGTTKQELDLTDDYTLPGTAPALSMELTSAGLAKLDEKVADPAKWTLVWEITATAGEDADNTSNTAAITVNGKTPPTEVEVTTPQTLHHGAYVMKQAKNVGETSNVPLAGAEFEIYGLPNAATGTCPAYAGLTAAGYLPAWSGGTLTSAATGKTGEMTLAAGSYCVYETKIPAGYKGDASAGTVLSVGADGAFTTIVNTQIGSDAGDLPSLPITGAQGRVLLALVGTGLVALAVGLYLVRRNRGQHQDA
ncbi:SpaH/EbpB family LPXTG-anchored major pilin [Actinomycetaceae bacterium MB13-C1-2]|nr:SpaH/EbpB family LPXTG-anchored major pilin [Actinomycetaceae bacterium MB13-C1-2]